MLLLVVRQIWELVEKVLTRADLRKEGHAAEEGAVGVGPVAGGVIQRRLKTSTTTAPSDNGPGGASSSRGSPSATGVTKADQAPPSVSAAPSKSRRSVSVPPVPSPNKGASAPETGSKNSRRVQRLSEGEMKEAVLSATPSADGPSPGPNEVLSHTAKRKQRGSKKSEAAPLETVPEAEPLTTAASPLKEIKARSPKKRPAEDAAKDSPSSKAAKGSQSGLKKGAKGLLPLPDAAALPSAAAASAPIISEPPTQAVSGHQAAAISPRKLASVVLVESPAATATANAAISVPSKGKGKGKVSAPVPSELVTAAGVPVMPLKGRVRGQMGSDKLVQDITTETLVPDLAPPPPPTSVGGKKAPLVTTVGRSKKPGKGEQTSMAVAPGKGEEGSAALVAFESAEAGPASDALGALGPSDGGQSSIGGLSGGLSSPQTGPKRRGPGKKAQIKGRPPVASASLAAIEGAGAGEGRV